MLFVFKPMDEASVDAISQWCYEPPYDIYNWDPDEIDASFFLDPQNAYYCIANDQGNLVAYCCFGLDAQVPGGDYSTKALDIGLGVRPDLTGQGHGLAFVNAVLDYASSTFVPAGFRVTVAAFNKRAQRVWEKAGFRPVLVFPRKGDGMSFVVLQRDA
jgi:RimJ/RimL family protein N-acetyltransferase